MKYDGTVEEINGVKIHNPPPIKIQRNAPSSSAGKPRQKIYINRESVGGGGRDSPAEDLSTPKIDLNCRVLQPDSSDNLVIAQEDDDIPNMPENGEVNPHEPENYAPENQDFHPSDNGYHGNQRGTNQHAQGWKCNICGQLMRDRNRLRLHKQQCAKNYQLPVRKPGQPVQSNSRVGIGQGKGHCCYHCDRMFPTKDELRNHVAEISKMNLAEY